MTRFSIGDNEIADLAPLKGMRLESFGAMRNKKLADISVLQDMPLTNLGLYACRAIKALPAFTNAGLRQINFEGTAINDLSPLKGQPIVWARVCCPVLDLSPLAGMPLEHLDVGGATGNDPNLHDISVVKGMKGMRDLRFDNTSVSDISALKDLKSLKFLAMFNTRVTDLTPIKDLGIDMLFITPKNFPPAQIQMLREMKSLRTIDVSWASWPNPQSAERFWKRYDAGEYTQPTSAPARDPR